MLRDLPPRARWYIIAVIAAGGAAFLLLLPRATLSPVAPLVFLVVLSSLTSRFKVNLPIASGSAMSVSYVVDIAALLLRGPHASMIVGAFSGWSQTTLNTETRNPPYRILFNIAALVLTVQAAGQVFERLGGPAHLLEMRGLIVPLGGMAITYFFCNTIPIAIAIALTTDQSAWRVWKTGFASSLPAYLIGAAAAAVVIQVTASSGYGLTILLTAAPLYLTYRIYRAGVETEARQGAILEAAHDAIVTIDQRLNIREFNPAAEQMFKRQRLDVLGRSIDILLPPEARQEQLVGLERYLHRGDGPLVNRRLEIVAVRSDGEEFPVELTVARVGSDSRTVLTAFIRDVTERRALEEQLRQSQKLEAIGRLASGVAHDFNNILMSIMGSADLLLMQLGPEDAARDETLEIKQSVIRGAGLTRQLLAFSRRQASRSTLFALSDVVGGMETMLRRLIGPEIDLGIAWDTAAVHVVADPAQIEQVVLNLAINARDAMPGGGRLSIRVDTVTLDADAAVALVEGQAGTYGRLTVSDTGTGIDAQTRPRLFEPFFTTKEQGKGTGLGLSIVYGIVKQSGGYIRVASEIGRGTTFVIYLPAATAARTVEAAVV